MEDPEEAWEPTKVPVAASEDLEEAWEPKKVLVAALVDLEEVWEPTKALEAFRNPRVAEDPQEVLGDPRTVVSEAVTEIRTRTLVR